MTEPSTYPSQLDVVEYPHPALRKVAEPVTVFDDALADFCNRLTGCMYDNNGVGLAAPQVAVSQRIFVTDHLQSVAGAGEPRVWINPRLENTYGAVINEEGCLSFPGIYAKVERWHALSVIYQDIHGVEHTQTMNADDNFLTIIIQHEFDHLDGIVFPKHLSFLQMDSIKRRLKELEKKYKKKYGHPGSVLRR